MPQIHRQTLLKAVTIVSVILLVLLFAISLAGIRSCALSKKEAVKGECSGDAPRVLQCDPPKTGRILQVCENGAWKTTSTECDGGCSKINFQESVLPLITNKCLSCHPGFNSFDTAKTKIDAFIARTSLPDNDAGRMPKAPAPPLSAPEKAIFTSWKTDGLLESCPDVGTTNPHIYLNDLELSALNDINSLTSGSQSDIRWLHISSKSDEGAVKSVLKDFERSISKGVSSISQKRILASELKLAPSETLFRVDLNDLGLQSADWRLIEAADPIDLESNTNVGILLKQLTKTKKPIMSVEAFLFASTKAEVYYAIRKIPPQLGDFLSGLGVNIGLQLANFQALQVGFANSPISLNKNRLLARFESNDSSLWLTFDINEIAAADKNLFRFPLLKSTAGKANYRFDASEAIFGLPNGLHGYALFDAQGKRLNAAALDIVAHNINPPADPTIKAANSCYRCHNSGFIARGDEVKASVDKNAINFDLRDVDLVDLLYRNPKPYFDTDNVEYANALAKIGILVSDKDPITVALDSLTERNLSAKMVAAIYLLTEAEFLDGLSKSADGRALIGTLLSGGTITFSQFVAANPIIKRDLRIGQEPIVP